jgi:hypothetical protein
VDRDDGRGPRGSGRGRWEAERVSCGPLLGQNANGLRAQKKNEGGLRAGLGCGAGLEAACAGRGLVSSFFLNSNSLSKQANQFEFKPGFESNTQKQCTGMNATYTTI